MDGPTYPVMFSVDYPDRELDRLTSFFRIFAIIPIAIVLGTVAGGTWEWSYGHGATAAAAGAGGLLFFGRLLMILFRKKYPRWWFDWNLELQRFSSRVLHLPGPDGGPVSSHRRSSVGAPRLRLPGRRP